MQEFRARLREAGARLMTIGYSFRDQHINHEIVDAASNAAHFGLFVEDPNGRRVFRPAREGKIQGERTAIEEVRYIGGSTRQLRTAFLGDELERGKLMRFFGPRPDKGTRSKSPIHAPQRNLGETCVGV